MSADDRFAARQEKRAPAAPAPEPETPKELPARRLDGSLIADAPLMMAITDARPAAASASAFIEGLIAFANDWWFARGGCGCVVTRAAYADDIATIETRPGARAITIADVRAAFVRKEAA